MMNDFKMKISPAYKHYNFTEDDIRYILWHNDLIFIKEYRNNYTIGTIYSGGNIIINSVKYYLDYGSIDGYICTINYKEQDDGAYSQYHVFANRIDDFLLMKKRDNIIDKII